jgi:hypothetical protein
MAAQTLQNGQQLFGQLPATLRQDLLDEYAKIEKNYREGRWEPTELDGGKYCEVVYCIAEGYLRSNYQAHATKPAQFYQACTNLRNIQTAATVGLDSMRLIIPMVLIGIYGMRNRRGVGHVGGDVNPNHMDATYIINAVKWVTAELIRVLHQTSIDEASAAAEALTERTLPYVWEVDGIKRVLIKGMPKADQVLHLLYATTVPVSSSDLAEWTETRPDNLKSTLIKLHANKLVHFNQATRMVTISTVGIATVEKQHILLRV